MWLSKFCARALNATFICPNDHEESYRARREAVERDVEVLLHAFHCRRGVQTEVPRNSLWYIIPGMY